jgi:hypothetical protein
VKKLMHVEEEESQTHTNDEHCLPTITIPLVIRNSEGRNTTLVACAHFDRAMRSEAPQPRYRMNSCYKRTVGAAVSILTIALSATRDNIPVIPIVPLKDLVEQGGFIIEYVSADYFLYHEHEPSYLTLGAVCCIICLTMNRPGLAYG